MSFRVTVVDEVRSTIVPSAVAPTVPGLMSTLPLIEPFWMSLPLTVPFLITFELTSFFKLQRTAVAIEIPNLVKTLTLKMKKHKKSAKQLRNLLKTKAYRRGSKLKLNLSATNPVDDAESISASAKLKRRRGSPKLGPWHLYSLRSGSLRADASGWARTASLTLLRLSRWRTAIR